jgi:DNA-binding MurR/RpiR family transcriptional regulator
MNGTNVSSPDVRAALASEAALAQLAAAHSELPPQLKKAATWVLENAASISVSSVREIAEAAGVKPNTLVRMARTIGFDGFDDFREPFRAEVRAGRESYAHRARWLQDLAEGGELDRLYGDMAKASMSNVEALFSATDATALRAASRAIIDARATFVLGMGIANPLARNFAYLASMAVDTVQAIPQDGALPSDSLARAVAGDVLLAMTFKPYRRDVVEAVELARGQGLTILALSDSPASPILRHAQHGFLVPVDTPQFFTSTVALSAFLEALMAFVIAEAGEDVVASIDRFHQRRHELGLYLETGE